jgi:hypothetical protein
MSFEWESVNAAVPARFFSYEDFEVPPATVVLDRRNGTPKRLATLGFPPDMKRPPPQKAPWWRVAGGISIGLMLLTLMYLYYRRYGARTQLT